MNTKERIKNILVEYVQHNHVQLVDRGNSAIKLALMACQKLTDRRKLLIPDQGGWITYRQFPKKMGFEQKEIETYDGLIEPKKLKEKVKNAAAILYANPAGYFANQDTEDIYATAKRNGCLVILDVAGCIGDPELCTGEFADFVIGSFGRWKPVNLEHGGFISFRKKDYMNKIISELDKFNFDEEKLVELENKLLGVKDRLKYFYGLAEKTKSDLEGFDVIHPEKRGTNVVVAFKNEGEKKKIIDYCDVEGFEYTLCPRYIRVLRDAVSIEIKRN